MKILIAEDDAVSRRLLRGHLERWGHEVSEAVDGTEAWDMIVKGDYPIVIADWMMPRVDGLELIRRIRARQLPRYTYILMLTAKNQKEDVVVGMDAGADDYLTKPFDREELRARLQAGQRILDLQGALLAAEKSAAVGRLATGVAAEISTPISDVLQSLIELRQDTHAMLDAITHEAEAGPADDDLNIPGLPARTAAPVDIESLRETVGPRIVSAESKLHRVRDLVRSLRDFSRLDDVPTRPLNLVTLISDTLGMTRQEFTSRELTADFLPIDDLPPVTGNAGKLKRALYNLLSALVETTARGGTIKITTASPNSPSSDGNVLIELSSTGPGIPAETLPHLFEPFARTGLQSGLGLPVAYSILREHGGTLEPRPHDDGTLFRIKLPAATR